jgi:hypothetical protein
VASVRAQPSPFRRGVMAERRRNGDLLIIRESDSPATPGPEQARPERAGEQGLPHAMRTARIARACLSVHAGSDKRIHAAGDSDRSVFAEPRSRLRRAECAPRFSFPLVIGEVAKHSRPAALRSTFSGLLPPRRLRVPTPENFSLGTAKLPPLGSSCTPRPSGQYVPTGQKPI